MKRKLTVFGVGVLLLLSSYAVVSGKRIASDNKTPATVEEKVVLPEKNSKPAQATLETAVLPVPGPEAVITAIESPETVKEPGAYQIPWQSINAGGEDISSTNYQLMFSVGQSVVGYATSINYEAGIGYWYGTGAAEECYCGNPGDMDNLGGAPTPLDVTFLVKKVYLSLAALCDRCNP